MPILNYNKVVCHCEVCFLFMYITISRDSKPRIYFAPTFNCTRLFVPQPLQAEVIEGSDNEEESSVVQAKDTTTAAEDKDDEERTESGTLGLRHRLADADLESDSGGEEAEVDEEALATRRQRLRERAISKIQLEEEVLGKEDEGSDKSSEDESSEYSEETDSEAEGPRLKPVFVRKKERHTIQQRETLQQSTKQVRVIG